MIRGSPVLPLIGGGTTKFQPVVGDMTAWLLELLARSETAGKTYEFGGPQVYSFKVLLELLLTALNRRRVLIPIPFALAEMQAGLLELLPNPPLTRDQVRLLKTDKVVSGMGPTLGDLGVQPWPREEFLALFKANHSKMGCPAHVIDNRDGPRTTSNADRHAMPRLGAQAPATTCGKTPFPHPDPCAIRGW
jgi:NADH dehydrogenase